MLKMDVSGVNLKRYFFLGGLLTLGGYSILLVIVNILIGCSSNNKYDLSLNEDSSNNLEDGVDILKGQRLIRRNWTSIHLKEEPIQTDCEVKVVMILCNENDSSKNLKKGERKWKKCGNEFDRQINQSLVMIKSILITLDEKPSSDCVKIIFISDKRNYFERLKEEIFGNPDIWNVQFTRRLKLSFLPLQYPKGTSWMRDLFRPCATLRLFLPDLLPTYDSILYLDTDIIFLRSVKDLWNEFALFNESTTAGMAPCLFHYGTSKNSIPYYGTSGLNAGIMLMNLTRMRKTQWTHKIRMVGAQYRSQIKLADQDILNIYFHTYTQELHLLSCDWNFRPFQCHSGSYCEEKTMKNGISALHGNALSFTPKGPEVLFFTIFFTFQNLQLTSDFDFEKMINNLENELEKVQNQAQSPCILLPGFDILVLSRLVSKSNSGESNTKKEKKKVYKI